MIHNHPDLNNTFRNNNDPMVKPYMGEYTSAQIGNMVKTGMLGGEMYRKVKEQENRMTIDDPQKFY